MTVINVQSNLARGSVVVLSAVTVTHSLAYCKRLFMHWISFFYWALWHRCGCRHVVMAPVDLNTTLGFVSTSHWPCRQQFRYDVMFGWVYQVVAPGTKS